MTKTPIRLTPRGEALVRLVKGIVVVTVLILVWGTLNDMVTPQECKVPLEEMTQGCIDLLYP